MHIAKLSFLRLTVIFSSITFFVSCNNSGNVPFPENELGYTQPVTVPLVFSATKKLKWDTAQKGGITPVIKKFDIDALPAFPYDSRALSLSANRLKKFILILINFPKKILALINCLHIHWILKLQHWGLFQQLMPVCR